MNRAKYKINTYRLQTQLDVLHEELTNAKELENQLLIFSGDSAISGTDVARVGSILGFVMYIRELKEEKIRKINQELAELEGDNG